MPTYYVFQSRTTDPSQYGYLFGDLPTELVDISQVVEGLIYHYFAGQRIYGWIPPKARLVEINTRTIVDILALLLEKDQRPLTKERTFEARMVGCCRDFALIACAILRHQGKPARLRYSFSSYLVPDYWIDHVIVETWNGLRWQRFEPRGITRADRRFNMLDLPPEAFLTGGRAWQLCRNGDIDPERFGLGPQSKRARGWGFIRERLQLDIAALNKVELLCWDTFGSLSAEQPDDALLLDKMADCSLHSDASELRRRCITEDEWRIPSTVHCTHSGIGISTTVTVS